MLLANFNLANTCAPCARARVFGGINFGDLVKNSPIRQIKIPTKVSGYTVYIVKCFDFREEIFIEASWGLFKQLEARSFLVQEVEFFTTSHFYIHMCCYNIRHINVKHE